jgi:hypothetical protein
MECLLAAIAGLSFLSIWAALTRPRGIARPQQAERPAQYRVRSLRGRGLLARGVEDLAAWFQGRAGDGETGGINARCLRFLKQADWWWEPGETTAPTPGAPFWNLETLWATRVFHVLIFGVGGMVVAGILAFVNGWGAMVPLVIGAAGAAFGFFDPGSAVKEAAEARRRQIVLEMGYKVPELRAYVQSGRTLVAAMRYLTNRPGGPFVRELHRALQVYDLSSDLERGLQVVMERNALCEPLTNLCGDLLAVVSEGGEVGVVLEAHAETALHEQRRQLRQQGQDNTQRMGLVVAGTTLVVMFVLIGGPALWTVMNSLGGM